MSLGKQTQALIEQMKQGGLKPASQIPIEASRAALTQMAVTIVFIHGGGMYLGDLETHDPVCRYLCKHAGLTVIAVDYALAPENKYPAGSEDCYAAH